MMQNKVEAFLDDLKTKERDIMIRSIPYLGDSVKICYIRQLVDRESLMEFVIKPLIKYCADSKKPMNAAFAADHIIFSDNYELSNDLTKAKQHIFNGKTIILLTYDTQYLIVDFKSVAHRNVGPPELMYSFRGPRDSFVEDLETNLSLLRYRIKDENIRIDKMQVGARTKSIVAVVYVEDIANSAVVNEVKKRIGKIELDAIYETGELQACLLNNKMNLFPQMGLIERPDNAVEILLEGKVLILVDGACMLLQAPKVFSEFFHSCDDRYENKFFGLFMRLIRYSALFLSVLLTSYYIALAEYHPDVMPASYIITFARLRTRAPFNAFIAVLIIELIVELIREALLRVPVKIGSAIAIVGAIIIGQAAMNSGFFSPLLLILVSISFLASFVIPDMTLSNVFRIVKFFVIILTGTFGFYGFSIAITFVFINLVSLNSFGVPFMAPIAPFKFYDFIRTLLFKKQSSPKRPQYLRNKDDMRTSGEPQKRR